MLALSGKWFDPAMGPDEKKQRELSIRHSRFALDLLTQVIEQEIEGLQNPKFEDYTLPGWDLREADRHGQIRALRNLLKMTKLEQLKEVKTND